MYEYKTKGCLIDSSHGKLQKKKEILLEFIFGPQSLCLTVSAQNMNITTYTMSKETINNILGTQELLVINFKAKNQIKISTIGKNKLAELKQILEDLLHDDINAYEHHKENFCQSTSKLAVKPSNVSTEKISPKPLKIDQMKKIENDENSQPISSTSTAKIVEQKKKAALTSALNFYGNAQDRSIDLQPSTAPPRKRSSENQPVTRFEHVTNATSPYFFQRAERKFPPSSSNGQTRLSPFGNIHSKPLTNKTRLWDFDLEDDLSLNTSTKSVRKKGLRNIGATCYMNSILQCLLNIDPFRYDLMVTNRELIRSSLLQDQTVYLCVLQILALLQDRQTNQSQTHLSTQLTDDERIGESQALSNLKQAVEKHSGHFFGSRQQDSHEFLNLVLSLITDEAEAIQNEILSQSSIFPHRFVDPTKENFQFCLATERCCQICGMSTIKREIHTALLIHVTDEEWKSNKRTSFTDLLENYFASETMDGCYCDRCQANQTKSIQYHLEQLPRIFIFYLKRWHLTKNSHGELESVSKEDHPIDYSMEINLLPFCSSTTRQPSMIDQVEDLPNVKDLLKQRPTFKDECLEAKRPKIEWPEELNREKDLNNPIATHADYRLCAVINHHGGSSDVGHYTSTVYEAKGKTWWTYDDTSVTSSSEEHLLKSLAPDAYGVMYIHKDILRVFQPVNEH